MSIAVIIRETSLKGVEKMTKDSKGKRSSFGYGSSYRRGAGFDFGEGPEISTVLGGQVWLVKPDKKVRAENPCIWMKAGVVEFKNCNNFYDCTTCNRMFLNLYSISWSRWKQDFWATVVSPVGGDLTLSRICLTKKSGGVGYGKITR